MSLRGEEGWKATHQKAYGKERWKALYKSLRSPVAHVALISCFMSEEGQRKLRAELQLHDHEHIPLVGVPPDGKCLAATEDELAAEDEEASASQAVDSAKQTANDSVAQGKASTEISLVAEDPVNPSYFLDGASVVAALALDVKPGDYVLDLCSAPGGKALVLASLLFAPASFPGMEAMTAAPRAPGMEATAFRWGGTCLTTEKIVHRTDVGSMAYQTAEQARGYAINPAHLANMTGERTGRLVCNESSKNRFHRLRRVLNGFLSADLTAPGGQVYVTNCDAAAGAPPLPVSRLGPFDKVLVDAPCTSDRHLAHQGSVALSKWAAGAVKANAERQLELLRCAAGLVKKGGTILYCTCALSTLENDGVVAKFLKKSDNAFAAEPGDDLKIVVPGAEVTEFGTLFLPDQSGYGPIYFARLRRL